MKQLVLLAALAIGTAAALPAAPMCVSASLDTYLVAGFECEINSAVFSNFGFSNNGGGFGVPVLGADEITVDPLTGLNEVGLRFSGAFETEGGPDGPGVAEGNRVGQYRFMYEVSRLNSEFFSASTVIDPNYVFQFENPLKFGGILLGKSITNDGALASSLINKDTTMPNDTVLLFTPRESIGVDDTFQLTGGASAVGTASPVGFVAADFIENRFAFTEEPVPEPATWTMLLGAGVLLFGIRRRRRD